MDELASFCRICAKQSDKVQNLFEYNYNGIMLAEILTHCIKRPVSKTDCLPQSICLNCKTNLLSTYEFHCLCDESELYFLKRINKIDDDNSETINTEIKIKNNFEFAEVEVDDIDFDVKCDEKTVSISEVVCLDENFIVEKGFECFECTKRFNTVIELRQHMTEHNTTQNMVIGKPFECITCNTSYAHINNWFRHRSTFHKNNIYECEHCSQAFNTLSALREHLPKMHKEYIGTYKCEQCSKQFAQYFLLVCHKERHKKAKQFNCNTCNTVFNTERKLNVHIRENHQSKNDFNENSKEFNKVSELREHMTENNTTHKPFECTTCNIAYDNFNSWVRHRSRIHKNNIYECEYCSSAFNSLSALKEHIPELHKENLDAYKCEQCSEKFALHFLLACHKDQHKKDKQYKCSTCDEVFFTERKLNAHIRDNHQSHLCAECGKSFKTLHLLEIHQMGHNPDKPFACDLCPSRFRWKSNLNSHMVVHTGQKKHTCDICNKSFLKKETLRKHKRIHTDDRRYQCETCPMRFYSNYHLKRHKLTHTGERPYTCSYCPRSFSQNSDLTKHLKSHVGQNMFQCDCGESFRLKTELRRHSYTHYKKDNYI